MGHVLSGFFDLREGERPLVVKAFFTLLLTIAAHTVLETARDALFLSKLPASTLNVVYIAVAALTFVASAASTRFAVRFGRRNALLYSLVLAAYLTTLLHFFAPGPRVALVLYVFTGLASAVLIPQFWLLAAQIFTMSQGRRLFGPIASGGVLGGVVGASIAAGMLTFAPVTTLLVVSAMFFLATALLCTSIVVEDLPPPASAPAAHASRESLRALFAGNPFLGRIAVLVALSSAAVLVVDYLFKSTAARVVPIDSLGSFFARFYAAMNAVSLIVQLLLSTHLLRRLGVVGAIAVMPLLLTLGGAGTLALGGTLAAVLTAKTFDGGLRHSLNRIATELLYLPLPAEARERGKALVDGVLSRVAQAATAVLLLALTSRAMAGPRALGAIIAALAGAWLATALLSRGRYLDLFRASLAGGQLGASPVAAELDLASAGALVEAMASSDPRRVVAAMNLIARKKHGKLIPALVLHHDAQDVLRRALEIFAESDRTDWHSLGERLLTHPREEVRIAALRALARHGVVRAVERATDDGSPRVRAYAAYHLAMRGDEPELVEHALIADVLASSGDSGWASRVGLLSAIADTPTARACGVLLALARDAEVLATPDGTTQMARAMEFLGDARFVPFLVARLPTRVGREAVRAALVRIGDPAFDALARALRDEATDPRVRLHVPRTIGRFGTQRACDLLTEQLAVEKVGLVRYKVLRGLGLMVGARVRIDRSRMEEEARRNLVDHLRTLGRRVAIAGRRRTPATRDVSGDGTADLLAGLLDDKLDQSLERVFRLLKLAHPREDLHRLHTVTLTGDRRARTNAIEYLDALLARPAQQSLRDLLRIVLDDIDDGERVARAAKHVGPPPSTEGEAAASLMEEHDRALATLAAHHAQTLGAPPLRAAVVRALEQRPQAATTRKWSTFSATARTRREEDVTKPDLPARTWRELFVASFLEGAPPDVLAWATPRLVSEARDLRVRAGETIYRAGEPAKLVYFVVSGSVRLDRPGVPPWTLGERSLVGMIDPFLGRPRSRDATAITATRLLELSVSEWFEVLEDSIDMAMRTVDAIASVLVDLRRSARLAPEHVAPDAGPRPVSLTLLERIIVLRRVDFLRRARMQTLATLAAQAEEVRLEPSDGPLVMRGDADDRAMLILAHGEVETTSGASGITERVGRGAMVGGALSFIETASFEARATRSTLALRLSAEDWFDVMEEHFDLTRSIITSLVAQREVLMNALGEAPEADEEAPMSRRRAARA